MIEAVMIPGDGIGPEVAEAAMSVLGASGARISWTVEEAGEHVLGREGVLVPDSVYAAIERLRLALKGPITTPVGGGHRSVNVELRKKYDLYQNVRPVRNLRGVETGKRVDLVIFRENTEDLYSGIEERVSPDEVHGIKVITRKASERIAEAAFAYAESRGRKKVHAVHKANIMKLADGLFLEAFRAVAARHPGIEAGEVIVDNMCMQLVMRPEKYDVIVTENLYGDILSDLAAGLVGGLGLVPGANIGDSCAIFEAVHGSAPDIAGQGKANPTALILSGAMLLDHVGETAAAARVRSAVDAVLVDGSEKTPDLGGNGTTASFAAALVRAMR